MTWVIWRQHRIEALIGGVLLLLTMGALFMTGLIIASAPRDIVTSCDIVNVCHSSHPFDPSFHVFQIVYYSRLWLYALPLLVGMFVGAPLVAHELEQGTFRLAWTQSIRRLRWFRSKLVFLLTALLVGIIMLTAVATWWSGIWIGNDNPVVLGPWSTYDLVGAIPIATMLFAFALGLTAGVLVRKTLLAVAITLIVFLLIRGTVGSTLRPYLLPPMSSTTPFAEFSRTPAGAMIVHVDYLDAQGHPHDFSQLSAELKPICGDDSTASSPKDWQRCVHDHGAQTRQFYQPIGRFWPFQAIEASFYLVLVLALLALSFWWLRKRIC